MSLLFHTQPLVVDKDLATILGLNEAIVLQQFHYWLEINRQADKNFIDGCYWTYNTLPEWQEQFPFLSIDTLKRTLMKLRKQNVLRAENYNRHKMDRTLWYTINYDVLEQLETDYFNATKKPTAAEPTEADAAPVPQPKKTAAAPEREHTAAAACETPETLDSTHCANLHNAKGETAQCKMQKRKMQNTNLHNASVQNALMQKGKMPQCISANCPDVLTEITTETSAETITSIHPAADPGSSASGAAQPDAMDAIAGELQPNAKAWQQTDCCSGAVASTPVPGNSDAAVPVGSTNADMELAVRQQLEADYLESEYGKDAIDGIVTLIADILGTTATAIRIGGVELPAERVKARLRQLNEEHIAYVMLCMEESKPEVRNIRQYLLTALYNAPGTMDAYFAMRIERESGVQEDSVHLIS